MEAGNSSEANVLVEVMELVVANQGAQTLEKN